MGENLILFYLIGHREMLGSLKTPSVMFSEQVMLDAFLRQQGKEHTSVLVHHQYKSHLFHFLFDPFQKRSFHHYIS